MPDPFGFDRLTGFITQNGTPRQVWVLCNHLRGPLARLLASGASLLEVTTSRSRTDLAVTLSQGPALQAIHDLMGPLDPDVSSWSNDDKELPPEFGIACRNCRQTLSWPPPA